MDDLRALVAEYNYATGLGLIYRKDAARKAAMDALPALLDRLEAAERDAARMRDAIRDHNAELQADCDARQGSDLCKAYVSRGRACPDCPRGYAIDAARGE